MNREIKFRAWDEDKKKMLDVQAITYWNQNPEIDEPCECEQAVQDHTGQWYRMFVLMQYTGLKDKNGKEIYEGDIVKHCDYNPTTVEFLDGRFFPLVMCKGNFIQEHKPESFEVIGNIYESPNLLK